MGLAEPLLLVSVQQNSAVVQVARCRAPIAHPLAAAALPDQAASEGLAGILLPVAVEQAAAAAVLQALRPDHRRAGAQVVRAVLEATAPLAALAALRITQAAPQQPARGLLAPEAAVRVLPLPVAHLPVALVQPVKNELKQSEALQAAQEAAVVVAHLVTVALLVPQAQAVCMGAAAVVAAAEHLVRVPEATAPKALSL